MAYYDDIGKGYNGLYGQEQFKKISIIKNNLKIGRNIKLLDVGCGTGISSDFESFVVGIDPSVNLLVQNNRLKILGAAEFLPFKDNSFDYVISVTSIHNFKNITKSMNEIKRVGKGNFVFSILKKSKKFGFVRNIIKKNFKIGKVIEEDKDAIFFCNLSSRNRKLYI